MKKIYSVFSLMIVMFMVISFVSCEKEEDNNKSNESPDWSDWGNSSWGNNNNGDNSGNNNNDDNSNNDNNDDNSNDNAVAPPKKLLRAVVSCDEDGYYEEDDVVYFTYNGQKQLTSVVQGKSQISLAWFDAEIAINATYERYSERVTLSMKNGMIVSSKCDGEPDCELTYDGNNRLISISSSRRDYSNDFIWRNGNIDYVTWKEEDFRGMNTYDAYFYDREDDFLFAGDLLEDPSSFFFEEDEFCRYLLMAYPTILGKRCKNPLKKYTVDDDMELTFTYKYDNDGYPIEIMCSEKGGSSYKYSYCYKLVWGDNTIPAVNSKP